MGKCNKMVARCYGSFEILRKIGHLDYELPLPPNIGVHNVFHISLLKKYILDPNHIIKWHVIQLEPKGGFHVQLVYILDRRATLLRNRAIG